MTLTYSSSNLPSWATLTASGQLTTSDAAPAGTYPITVSLTDGVTTWTKGTSLVVLPKVVPQQWYGLLQANKQDSLVFRQTVKVYDRRVMPVLPSLLKLTQYSSYEVVPVLKYKDSLLFSTKVQSMKVNPAVLQGRAGLTAVYNGVTNYDSNYDNIAGPGYSGSGVVAYTDYSLSEYYSWQIPNIGFDFVLYGTVSRTNIRVASNSFVSFSGSTFADDGAGDGADNLFDSVTPPGKSLKVGAKYNSMLSLWAGSTAPGTYRIRWEGFSEYPSGSIATTPLSIWELTLYADGHMYLAAFNMFTDGYTQLSKGDGLDYSFIPLIANGGYTLALAPAGGISYTVQ